MSDQDSQRTVLDVEDAAIGAAATAAGAPAAAAAAAAAAAGALAAAPAALPAAAAAGASQAHFIVAMQQGDASDSGDDGEVQIVSDAASGEDDDVQIVSGGGPCADPSPPPWHCLLCTTSNPPLAPACDACRAYHGPTHTKALKNYMASSEVYTPTPLMPWLYVGAATSAEGPWLHFFTHIVCVCELAAQHPAAYRGSDNFALLPVPGSSGRTITPAQYRAYGALLAPAFAVMGSARRQGGRVLVHCEHGMSRSVCVVAAYLLAHPDALPPGAAAGGGSAAGAGASPGQRVLAFIKSKRGASNPAKGFVAAVEAFGSSRGGSSGSGGSGSCTVS
jgi:hypothetical protein